ncbi:calcium permeable stress-gated cation channel 1 [Schistocerca piceifrons]|uniref:calcium permeable stress-gated cation channel 1 n=1 Tax=Schistocerca piceifrons TaxID=274613 RepID=UPI001F5FDB26|nr:calcium permeable stress-gated cation channel 1 [Schistocerca piceifrons]
MVRFFGETLFSETGQPDGAESCAYYNKTTKRIITSVYEGIPENFLLNFLGWALLLLLFAILRKRAWNYGRLALVQKTEERWTQLFYARTDEMNTSTEADSLASLDSSVLIDKGFCSWFTALFRLKDENILQKCGPDAVQYLSFQRHIIFYLSVVMVISLAVVLPVNFQGNLGGDEETFGHTTLSNLDPSSPYLWIHVTLAILYLPLGIIVMRRFSVTMRFEESDTAVSRTLMITNIPRKFCDSADIRRHFQEAHPDVEVDEVQLAYDITRVSALEKQREKAYQAKLYCENYLKTKNERLLMRPYACGSICCCDSCCPPVDALEYYTEEEANLREKVDTERNAALRRPVGVAFVTLASTDAAQKVFEEHKATLQCASNPPHSTLSKQLRISEWRVQFTPSPKDIFWENLSVQSNYWYIKATLVNFFLFFALFFLTTPAIMVKMMETFHVSDEIGKMSPVLSEFLPTLLLWTASALLPVIVAYSDQWLSHWTRSEQNHSIMRKTFIFLLFMVLILPSLGLTSAQAFVEWTLSRNETYRWKCVFLPDKGAFFVNYVITSAFIGTALELIRFPELIMYAVRLCWSRSKAESASVRKAIFYEFPFGVQYAWTLLIFATTVIYSLPCPLITPCGLLYMVLKHFVDRYNIYWAYGPSKISSRIHASAINIVIFSISLLQLSFVMLSYIRNGFRDITIYSAVGFFITMVFLWTQVVFHCCKGFSPISYQNGTHNNWQSPSSSTHTSPEHSSGNGTVYTSQHRFVPAVLRPSVLRQPDVVSVQTPAEGISVLRRTYGTGSPDGPAALTSPDHILLYQDYEGGHGAEV